MLCGISTHCIGATYRGHHCQCGHVKHQLRSIKTPGLTARQTRDRLEVHDRIVSISDYECVDRYLVLAELSCPAMGRRRPVSPHGIKVGTPVGRLVSHQEHGSNMCTLTRRKLMGRLQRRFDRLPEIASAIACLNFGQP